MDKKIKWYDSANTITSLIIGVIVLIIIFSQSFAFKNGSLELFTSVINHNSVYLFILIYFIVLKLSFGKKYFNYINVFLIFIYFITTITSFLTLVQVFSINSSLDFILNVFLLIYLVHTLLRDTRVWREFYLSKSPFNELSNDFIFYSIIVVSIILLAINLISTVVFRGVIISILDTIYIILISRYIYLYRVYLEKKGKIKEVNMIDFGKVKEKFNEVDKVVSDKVDSAFKKINDYVEENKIEEKIDKAKEKVKEASKEFGKDINNMVDEAKKDIKKASKQQTKSTTKTSTKSTTKKSTKKGDK